MSANNRSMVWRSSCVAISTRTMSGSSSQNASQTPSPRLGRSAALGPCTTDCSGGPVPLSSRPFKDQAPTTSNSDAARDSVHFAVTALPQNHWYRDGPPSVVAVLCNRSSSRRTLCGNSLQNWSPGSGTDIPLTRTRTWRTASISARQPAHPSRWVVMSRIRDGSRSNSRYGTVNSLISLQVMFSPHPPSGRSEEHTSELQSQSNLVCRLLLEKKKNDRCVSDRRRLLVPQAVTQRVEDLSLGESSNPVGVIGNDILGAREYRTNVDLLNCLVVH